MRQLIHYTSLIVALNILKSKKVKFGDLRKSNDFIEFEAHNEDEITLFAFCTSSGEFDALMWLAYSKGESGAALVFNFKTDKSYKDLFNKEEIKSDYVKYVPDYYYSLNENDEIGLNLGWIKCEQFKKEEEYRFLIKEDGYCLYSKLIKINIEALESIDIIVSPFAKNIVETFVKGLYVENDNEIKINVIINEYNM